LNSAAGALDCCFNAGYDATSSSPTLPAELERVLLRPKFGRYVTESESLAFVALLQRLATIVPDPPLIVDLTPDPGDDYLVVLARASGAQTLVC
jgi:predicted nucleic acid-binding protein